MMTKWSWGLTWILQLRMTPRTTSRPLCFGPKFLTINSLLCCVVLLWSCLPNGVSSWDKGMSKHPLPPIRPQTPRATHLDVPQFVHNFFWQSASELVTKVNYLWTSLGPPSSASFERAPCQVSSFKEAQRDLQAHWPPQSSFLKALLSLVAWSGKLQGQMDRTLLNVHYQGGTVKVASWKAPSYANGPSCPCPYFSESVC